MQHAASELGGTAWANDLSIKRVDYEIKCNPAEHPRNIGIIGELSMVGMMRRTVTLFAARLSIATLAVLLGMSSICARCDPDERARGLKLTSRTSRRPLETTYCG